MRAQASFEAPFRHGRVLLPASAAALGLVTVLLAPRSNLRLTTHAGASVGAEVASLAAGLSLLGVGLLIWLVRPGNGRGARAASLAGLAWFAQDWIGWEGGPGLVRSVGMVVEPFFLAAVIHLVLAGPGGRLVARRVRMAAGAVYVLAATVSIGRALFRDPFLDPHCWSNCTTNVFLLSARPGVVRALDGLWMAGSLVGGLSLSVGAVWRLASATGTGRRAVWPILVPAALIGGATAAHVVALLRTPLESPLNEVFSSLFVARALATAALAAGLGAVLVRARRTQVAVARLATDLGDAPPPGSLGQALARASGDPTLEVVYPLASGHVDASGRSVAAPAVGGGRAVTPIVRGGREVALVVHDAASVDAGQLRHEIGAAARLAVENERLQAELLAQLSDLRASRARVVEAGDAERQRLERNLHDGAQQRLLALLYDLRLARAEAESLDAPELTTLLGLAADETKAAIADLRDLAHGIYPAVLTEGGLGPAMWTLAEGAPIPVILGETPEERFTEAVERTAYAVAAEAVEAAGRSGSSQVAVRVVREDDRLIVEVEGAVGVFVHLADRVGAVGGELTHESGRLRAEIPCG